MARAHTQSAPPQALLLQGMSGVGKQRFAQQAMAGLLCSASSMNGQPCGRCDACQWFIQQAHPDCWLAPKTATNLKLDSIAELIEFCQLSPQCGIRKVALLPDAHRLTTSAANALLKTLEEPATSVTLFLTTAWPGLILPTIRSRCQTVRFSRPTEAVALAWLSQSDPTRADWPFHLQLAEGAPLLAWTNADKNSAESWHAVWNDLTQLTTSAGNVVAIAEAWHKESTEVATWILLGLEALLRQPFNLKNEMLLAALPTAIRDRFAQLPAPWVLNYRQAWLKFQRQRVLQLTDNPQLGLEQLLLQWQSFFASL